MNNEAIVEVVESIKKLQHDALHLWLVEGLFHIVN